MTLPRLILSFIAMGVLLILSGLVILATWDVPVEPTQVEKTLDNGQLLQKGP